MKNDDSKYQDLINCFKKLGDAAVAFSGGVDSTFLLYAAKEALGDHVLAMTIQSPYMPRWEISEAREIAENLGVRHLIVDAPIAEQIKNNPKDRCYLCKTFVFKMLKELARKHGFNNVVDGTNSEDSEDDRPGMKALTELGIKSPLKEAGFNKTEIRKHSKIKNLPTWEKPAYACLLTRIPYDQEIDEDVLRRIDRSEKFLIGMGIRMVRVRVHNDLARIETSQQQIQRIIRENLMETISRQLKRYGFKYVTLDLEGYRTGSFKEALK